MPDKSKSFDEDTGLVWANHGPKGLVYGCGHGFGRGWLPTWLQDLIVSAVNFACCRIWGHDTTLMGIREGREGEEDGSFTCTMCCKKLRT